MEYEEKDDIDFNARVPQENFGSLNDLSGLTRVPPPISTTQQICGIRQNFHSQYHQPPRVSVQGVKSPEGHFACFCREFHFLFSKRKGK